MKNKKAYSMIAAMTAMATMVGCSSIDESKFYDEKGRVEQKMAALKNNPNARVSVSGRDSNDGRGISTYRFSYVDETGAVVQESYRFNEARKTVQSTVRVNDSRGNPIAKPVSKIVPGEAQFIEAQTGDVNVATGVQEQVMWKKVNEANKTNQR